MSAGSIFRSFGLFLAMVLCCVGTGVSQIKFWFNEIPPGATYGNIYLYNMVNNANNERVSHHTLLGCKKYNERFAAAYAFAIISCVVVGLAFITSALQIAVPAAKKIGQLASTGLAAFGFVTTLLTWAIVVGTFRATPCSSDLSIKDQGGAIDTGVVLFICAFGIILVTLIASVRGLTAADSDASQEVVTVNTFTRLRVVIVFVAAVFACIGTGLPQLKAGYASSSERLYLYQVEYRYPALDQTQILRLGNDFAGCNEVIRRLRAAYAFAILSCIFTIFAFIAVAVQFSAVPRLAKGLSVVVSFFGFVVTLIAWGIVVSTWYKEDICEGTSLAWWKGFKAENYALSSGVVLLVISWIFMTLDLILAIVSVAVGTPAAAPAAATEMKTAAPTAESEPAANSTSEPTEA